jgi:leader peptidase (prepilin peptidase)/N-methyltransferase
MSFTPDAAALGALLCGAAGLAVPALVRRLPDPAVSAVAARSRLRTWAVLLSALSGALVGGSVGLDWSLLFLLPLVPVAVALALVDLHTHLLPTRVIWPAAAGTVALAVVAALLAGDGEALARAAVCGLLVFAVFHAIWWIHPAGMGYGDVRLSALIGFALGYLGGTELLLGLYGAFVVFAVLGVARAVVRRDRRALREPLPFGPFLLVGALAGIVLGGHLVSG